MPLHFLPDGFSPRFLEDLLEALHVAASLLQMLFEAVAKLVRIGGLGHLGQSLHQLVFGVVNILQFVDV